MASKTIKNVRNFRNFFTPKLNKIPSFLPLCLAGGPPAKQKLAELAYSKGKIYCCVIFLKRLLGRPPLLGACSARGPEAWRFGLIMQLITSTVKDKV